MMDKLPFISEICEIENISQLIWFPLDFQEQTGPP